jgi:hypothetical protein
LETTLIHLGVGILAACELSSGKDMGTRQIVLLAFMYRMCWSCETGYCELWSQNFRHAKRLRQILHSFAGCDEINQSVNFV